MNDEHKTDGPRKVHALVRQEVRMSLYLGVECPNCGENFDLNTPEFNDECQFTAPIFDGHDWRERLVGMEFECPECSTNFELGEIQY